jgi:capsular polysaccharide transport system permease protein
MAAQLESNNYNQNVRSPGAVTWAVWKALFLREALVRLSAGRAAWLWLLMEPIAHVVVLMLLFGLIRHRDPFGVPGPMFIMSGVLTFMMMRNPFSRSAEAIRANAALFAYRQVRPVDTVIIRAALEGFLLIIVAMLLLFGSNMIGYEAVPHDPLAVFLAFALMWQAGLGMGLLFSVGTFLAPEIGKVVNMLNRPLYLASCVMFPSMLIPQPYRDWVMLNPFAHGVEAMRAAFFFSYQAASQTSLSYLALFGQLTVFLGLSLHMRFAKRLTAR